MRRNLFVVVLIPCILSCVLIILIIMDKQHDAKKEAYKPTESIETSGLHNQTESETSMPTTTDAPIVTPVESQNTIPTTRQTTVQTQTAATAPTSKETSAATSEKKQDETPITTKNTETKLETEPTATDNKYDALYTRKGETYTLIADKVSKHFIFINNQDSTVRKTEFTYQQKYERYPGEFYGPILGYKNKIFVFIAENNIVVSDGNSETIIITLDNENESDDFHISTLLESENRLLVGIDDDTLYMIDCRSLAVEKYTEDYSDLFFVFTDNNLCFSSRRQTPVGQFYTYIYSAKNGEARLLGSIGEIDDFVQDNDIVYIQSQGELFQINLKTSELTSSKQLDRERVLYFPVYGSCIIQDLSEIRYINYNNENKPAQSKQLPEFIKAECYYGAPYAKISYSLYFSDAEKMASLPLGGFGSFAMIDRIEYPLKDGKFILHSTVKEKLYSGKTALGEGEIFLLERIETKNNDSILFEMIYAWIPINELYAYQFYIYVPTGDTAGIWLNVMKQLLQID